MNRIDANRTARPAHLLRLAGAALMLIALSGCAGWGARERPQLAPAPPPPEPFALNSFELQDDTDVVGRLRYTTVQGEETLLDIARAYDLGYDEMLAANPGVDPWTPASGQRVLLPTAHVLPDAPREGIVINLAARRLFYYPPRHDGEPRAGRHPSDRHRSRGLGDAAWHAPKWPASRPRRPGPCRPRSAASTPPRATRCRPSCRRGRTIRSAATRCAWAGPAS